jgi:hypothetical protein
MLDWSVKQRNIFAGIILIMVSIGYGYATSGLPDRTLPNTPDPAFLPWINAILLGVLAVLLLWQGIQDVPAGRTGEPDGTTVLPPAIFVGAFFVFILLLPVLGFIGAGIPFFAAIMFLFGERRLIWLLASSVGTTVILFAIFRYGFNIILPRGAIG